MNIRKASIDGKMYTVLTPQEFSENVELNNNNTTAITVDGTVYPIRSQSDNRVGAKIDGPFIRYTDPQPDQQQYSASNIVDLSNVKNMEELISKQEEMKNMERSILTSPDNLTIPNISSLDTPEMKAVKEVIIAKRTDLDKYAERFGPNFANDKRILKTNSITMKMIKRLCENIDVKVSLVFEDRDPDVPNPMGKKIVADITGLPDEDNE